jgi:hypothetical protein
MPGRIATLSVNKLRKEMVDGRGDQAEWLERLAANAKVATVLAPSPASFYTVESEGRQMQQC